MHERIFVEKELERKESMHDPCNSFTAGLELINPLQTDSGSNAARINPLI
jgi:hypothetical protein